MANTNLANAKTAKNDEFYTQYPDIQKEINAYLDFDPNVFRSKTVLLPCDDPEWSNFTKVSHLLGVSLSARVSKMDILRKPLSMDI